jgi:two-component system nitrogen regulation sensor histidine kinase NtrY
VELEQHRDHALAEFLPEIAPLLAMANRLPAATAEGQIQHETEAGARVLLVRVTDEVGSGAGTVVTFTDITDLLDAQRKAAWSDVARRIAHEIKNPLTPIQLSAERLKRRYQAEITSDPETFVLCTDTIVRQVDSLRRMVDEFSNFARLPAAQKSWCDITALVRHAVALEHEGSPDVFFDLEGAHSPIEAWCDADQISQVLTNILQNAVQAIAQKAPSDGGRVAVALSAAPEWVTISVTDNGIGLPAGLRERLTDPYVTTKSRGTGLGLSIVQKIVEDHDGHLRFEDAPGGGARVTAIIRKTPADSPNDGGAAHGA